MDVTATQFGQEYPKVMICRADEIADRPWAPDSVVRGAASDFKEWPDDQRPLTRLRSGMEAERPKPRAKHPA